MSGRQWVPALAAERTSHRLIEQGHAVGDAALLHERAAYRGHRQQLEIGVPIGPADRQHLTGQPLTLSRIVGDKCGAAKQLTPQLWRLGLDDPRRPRQPAAGGRHVPHELLVITNQGQRRGSGQHRVWALARGRVGTLQRLHHGRQITQPVTGIGQPEQRLGDLGYAEDRGKRVASPRPVPRRHRLESGADLVLRIAWLSARPLAHLSIVADNSGRARLPGLVTDGLDVVAVGVADEGSVVAGVVLRPHARLVQDLRTAGGGGLEEGVHRRAVRRGEGDVRLAEAVPGGLAADPEIRHGWHAVPDGLAEVQHPPAAERGQDGVVEGGAGRQVSALDRNMIEHAPIVPAVPTRGTDRERGALTRPCRSRSGRTWCARGATWAPGTSRRHWSGSRTAMTSRSYTGPSSWTHSRHRG